MQNISLFMNNVFLWLSFSLTIYVVCMHKLYLMFSIKINQLFFFLNKQLELLNCWYFIIIAKICVTEPVYLLLKCTTFRYIYRGDCAKTCISKSWLTSAAWCS